MASFPPPRSERDRAEDRPSASPPRPRYLAFVVMVTLMLGAASWTEGCARLEMYRTHESASETLHGPIRDRDERARLEGLYRQVLDAADETRKRTVPFATATFVLGAAILALGSRGLSRRGGMRHALVQLVAVQAVVVATGFLATSRLRASEEEWDTARRLAVQREAGSPAWMAPLTPIVEAKRRFGGQVWLSFRMLGSLFVLVALTRPRTRDFFEGEGTVSER